MNEQQMLALAARWKLRAMELEKCGVVLASSVLRECAEEVEAGVQGREPKRTSYYEAEQK